MNGRQSGSRTVALAIALATLVCVGIAPAAQSSPVRTAQPIPLQLDVHGSGAILLGSEAVLWANATGGFPPYHFTWRLNGTNQTANVTNTSAVGQRYSFLPLGDAIYTVSVSVRDSGVNSTSQLVPVQVTGPGPVAVTLTVLGSTSDGGVRLRADPAGGSPPYQFRWVAPGIPGGWSSAAYANVTNLPDGATVIQVIARDAQGFQGSARLTVNHSTQTNPLVPIYVWFVIGLVVAMAVVLLVLYLRRLPRAPRA